MNLVLTNITQCWNSLRPLIAQTYERFGWTDLPEDLYSTCRTGFAQVYTNGEDFVIVQNKIDELFGTRTLYILFAYCSSGNALDYLENDLIEIAKITGATKLQFLSPRAGFLRVEKSYPGWRTRAIIFEKEIV